MKNKVVVTKRAGRPREFSSEHALSVAARVFAEKGYGATSLGELTEAMEISRPSLYAAFGNKIGLYLKALDLFMRAREKQLADYFAVPNLNLHDALDRLLRDDVAMFTDPTAIGGGFFTQGALSGPEITQDVRREIEHKRAGIERALRRRFERAVKDGEVPKQTSADDLARYYSAVIQGIALSAQHGATREQLVRIVELAMRALPHTGRKA